MSRLNDRLRELDLQSVALNNALADADAVQDTPKVLRLLDMLLINTREMNEVVARITKGE